MCNALQLISTQPTERTTVVTDLYRLLLDRLIFSISGCFVSSCMWVDIEVLLNGNSGVMSALQNKGVQKVLGDVCVSESDRWLLV